MIRLASSILIGSIVALAAGCAILDRKPEAKQVYILPEVTPGKHFEQPLSDGIVIGGVHASTLLNSSKILFRRDDLSIGEYQFASWAESPASRLQTIILLAFEEANIAISVAPASSLIGARNLVSIELLEFYHDAITEPGAAVVKMRAELLDTEDNSRIGSTIVEKKVPAESYDARGAITALHKATQATVDALIEWTAAQLTARK
jgi:ABC-type uncharacterized transport system auxiliary subunit